jgi:hypothetical protein
MEKKRQWMRVSWRRLDCGVAFFFFFLFWPLLFEASQGRLLQARPPWWRLRSIHYYLFQLAEDACVSLYIRLRVVNKIAKDILQNSI